ncbi:hypothetical protein A2U01_0062570, partial [Trifolium medium]|nr:hypothetical protein [Trifolium medium]
GDMTSVQARVRAAKNAKKKTFDTVSVGTPSGQASPSPVVEVVHEKRPHEEDPREAGPRKNPRVDSAGGSGGLHRVHPGVSAELFVLPSVLGYAKLFDGQTQLVVSEPEKEILEDMGA